MLKHMCKTKALLFTLVIVLLPYTIWAGDTFIPGDTPEEAEINMQILEGDDEQAVIGYLSDTRPSVRMTVCMKLGDIGTSYSLVSLENSAKTDENWEVKEEASFSLWKIRYKEEVQAGNAESVLLNAIDTYTTPAAAEDVTKTARVKGWAMGLLGDMGSQNAITLLNTILSDTADIPYSTYLQESAEENLKKIAFINSFEAGQGSMVIVEAGLQHSDLCIRKWALDALVKLNPPDLMDRLKALFAQAEAGNDDEFMYDVAEAIDKVREKQMHPAIEIVYPQDGAKVKADYVEVFGYINGKPFSEVAKLISLTNIYTKTAIDEDGNEVSKSIKIYRIRNASPVITPIPCQKTLVGRPVTFSVIATDADDANLIYFTEGLPEGANFNYDTHVFLWVPTRQWSTYQMKFRVEDPYGMSDEKTVTITVMGDLALSTIGDKTVNEGQKLEFVISATDLSNMPLTYFAENLPPGASFNGNSRVFSWVPNYEQAGEYGVTFCVFNGSRRWNYDYETITIRVQDVNRPPVLNEIGDKETDEDQQLEFGISATDPDGQSLTYSADNLPPGASFDDNSTFRWTPAYDQAGEHRVTFKVSDGQYEDCRDIIIRVNNVNRPPALDEIGDKNIVEDRLLEFAISGTDQDGDALTYNTSNLPEGASLDSNGAFNWTPAYGQAGSFPVHFTVSDGQAEDSKDITITVDSAN